MNYVLFSAAKVGMTRDTICNSPFNPTGILKTSNPSAYSGSW